MNALYNKLLVIAMVVLLIINNSCSHKSASKNTDTSTSDSVVTKTPYSAPSQPLNNDNDEESTSTSDDDESKAPIEDGTYSATVDYSNPTTGYSATYTLDVIVSDGQVIQINFPNDGYLDEDHISPADIDEDGNASVEGEDGKTYDVHISI